MAEFDDITVGDQVIVSTPGRGGTRSIAKVERVTATQFVAGGYRFTKRGWQVGGDTYWSATAKTATPELIAQVQAEQRYQEAQDKLRRKLNEIETLWREIDRDHGRNGWAATLEAALPHLFAAAEVLKVRQGEIDA